jgi:thiosulfate/3-mercaptopyruvate sulfurtransferase
MTASPLVSTAWLAEHLDAPDVIVIDASMHLPTTGRDANAEYLVEHIPGALRFDIDVISDPSSSLPHTMPQPHVFSSQMRKLGIGDGQTIVAYDSVGLYSSPRAWWMFKTMGVDQIFILDGGLPKWKAEGRSVEGGAVVRPERHFTARMDNGALASFDDVSKTIRDGSAQILDARAAGRFSGETPEPRAGMRSGHMPGAFNLPFTNLLREDGTLKPAEDLRAIYAEAGIDLAKPVITSCGSGVTAAVLTLGLSILGAPNLKLYDGSWSEWGSRDDTEVVTGA